MQQRLGQDGGEAEPVAVDAALQLVVLALVGVLNDRAGVVDDGPAVQHDSQQGLDIGAVGQCLGVEGGIERTGGAQRLDPEGHVGAGAEDADVEGEERIVLGPVGAEVVGATVKTAREARVALEPDLCLGLHFQRRHQAGDGADPRRPVESLGNRQQPVAVGDHVVVGEGDDLVRCLGHSGVASIGATWDRLVEDAYSLVGQGSDDGAGSVIGGVGAVIDQDHLEAVGGVVAGENRGDRLGGALRSIPGRNHDRDPRCPGEELPAGLQAGRQLGPVEAAGAKRLALHAIRADMGVDCARQLRLDPLGKYRGVQAGGGEIDLDHPQRLAVQADQAERRAVLAAALARAGL